jgi:hypothetical protein
LERGFSFSFWVKFEGVTQWGQTLFDFGNGIVDNICYFDQGNGLGGLQLASSDPSNTAYYDLLIPDGMPRNTWVHLVLVIERTGSTGTWKAFKNGVQVQVHKSAVSDPLVSAIENFYYPSRQVNLTWIGRSNWPDQQYSFTGKVDSFGVFLEPLGLTQASLLFQSTGIRASARIPLDALVTWICWIQVDSAYDKVLTINVLKAISRSTLTKQSAAFQIMLRPGNLICFTCTCLPAHSSSGKVPKMN